MLWLVTGKRGSGKSTLCHSLAEAARRAGWDVAGVVSLACLEGGHKTGIDCVDMRSGQRRRLASRRHTRVVATGEVVTGAWAFDDDALAWGNTILRESGACDLLIVDELGPLEFECHRGWTNGLQAVTAGNFRHALVVVRPELLTMAQTSWPHAQVIEISGRSDRTRLLQLLGLG